MGYSSSARNKNKLSGKRRSGLSGVSTSAGRTSEKLVERRKRAPREGRRIVEILEAIPSVFSFSFMMYCALVWCFAVGGYYVVPEKIIGAHDERYVVFGRGIETYGHKLSFPSEFDRNLTQIPIDLAEQDRMEISREAEGLLKIKYLLPTKKDLIANLNDFSKDAKGLINSGYIQDRDKFYLSYEVREKMDLRDALSKIISERKIRGFVISSLSGAILFKNSQVGVQEYDYMPAMMYGPSIIFKKLVGAAGPNFFFSQLKMQTNIGLKAGEKFLIVGDSSGFEIVMIDN